MFSFCTKKSGLTRGIGAFLFLAVVLTNFSPLFLNVVHAQSGSMTPATSDDFLAGLGDETITRTSKNGDSFIYVRSGVTYIITDPNEVSTALNYLGVRCAQGGGATSDLCTAATAPGGALDPDPTDPIAWDDSEYWTTGYFLIEFTGILLGLSGSLLDAALQWFVYDMGRLVSTKIGDSVEYSWGVVRDLVNLTFVFGLIYVGLLTILKGDGAGTRGMLVSIVIGALLVNFSLYFAKVIIDLANVTTYQIYTQMSSVTGGKGIADYFQIQMGTVQLMGAGGSELIRTAIANGTNMFSISILVSITFLIASFVFLAGAVMITARFVALVILMILSPIAFAAAFLPKVKGWSQEWWDKIIAHAMFAPIFVFILFIAARIASIDVMTSGPGGNIFSVLSSTGSAAELGSPLIQFAMIIGFLVASLIVAKLIGAIGSTTALNWGKSARKFAVRQVGSATFGATAGVGRSTIGRVGHILKDSDRVQTLATQKGLKGFVGKRLLNTAEKTSQASFDARRVAGLGKTLGVGEGKKGGYEQRIKDIEKKEKAFADKLGEDEKVYEQMGVGDKYVAVKEKRAAIEEGYRKLSETSDAAARNLILANISTLGKEINNIEQDKTFIAAKAQSNHRKREYAANLENRGKELPLVARQLYSAFVRNAAENKAGAKAIRKDLDKSAEKKLLDALKKELKDGGGTAGGVPPPAAAEGGGH